MGTHYDLCICGKLTNHISGFCSDECLSEYDKDIYNGNIARPESDEKRQKTSEKVYFDEYEINISTEKFRE